MYSWDDVGSSYLEDAAGRLRDVGVVEWFQRTITDVWRINTARFEPDALGDTARAFGILSSDNIQQRTLVAARSECPPWQRDEVQVRNPEGSLLVSTYSFDLHVVKAPSTLSRVPAWEQDFNWTSKSQTRLKAAIRNAARLAPVLGSENQFALFDQYPQANAHLAVEACRDLFVVWSGELETGLTAGWLGMPRLGASSWLAVQPLWWDEPNLRADTRTNEGSNERAGSFGTGRVPEATVSLRPGLRKETNVG
jgi:hypothetical protein